MLPHTTVVFDTETNKLPDFSLPADHPDQPRLASFCAIVLDAQLIITAQFGMLVQPDGWTLEPAAAAVNGLSDVRLRAEGVPVGMVLDVYERLIGAGHVFAAYNARFDLKIMRGELRRAGRADHFEETRNICLMNAATKVLRRRMKLAVAYESFVGTPMGGKHTSLGDAWGAMEVLRGLAERGALPKPEVFYAKGREP